MVKTINMLRFVVPGNIVKMTSIVSRQVSNKLKEGIENLDVQVITLSRHSFSLLLLLSLDMSVTTIYEP